MTMRRRLFSIGGTTVYLHLATLIFAAYMVLLGKGLFLLISILSILLHEAAHSVVSALFGHPPGEVEITPFGALMRLDDDSLLPFWRRLLVLAAGPMASLALCWLAIILTKAAVIPSHIGRLAFTSNLLLTVFNLLPALPLDGGRLLALLLSLFFHANTVRKTLRVLGTLIGLVLIGTDLFLCIWLGSWNFSLCMAGCFLLYAAAVGTTTQAMAELRRLMDRKITLESRGMLRCAVVAVTARTPLRKAVEQLSQGKYTLFCLLENGTMRLVSCIGEEQLITAYLDKPWAMCSEMPHVGKQACIGAEKPCYD